MCCSSRLLANGAALRGLIELVRQGARRWSRGRAIEKRFQARRRAARGGRAHRNARLFAYMENGKSDFAPGIGGEFCFRRIKREFHNMRWNRYEKDPCHRMILVLPGAACLRMRQKDGEDAIHAPVAATEIGFENDSAAADVSAAKTSEAVLPKVKVGFISCTTRTQPTTKRTSSTPRRKPARVSRRPGPAHQHPEGQVCYNADAELVDELQIIFAAPSV